MAEGPHPVAGPALGGPSLTSDLSTLARLYGVQTSYVDSFGRRRRASPEALVAVLRSLGAPVEDRTDAAGAVEARRRELSVRLLEPVVVAWDGRAPSVSIRVPASLAERRAGAALTLEGGARERWTIELRGIPGTREAGEAAEPAVVKQLPLPAAMPLGYHRLRLEVGGRAADSLVIAAPRRSADRGGRDWGLFMPLYAIRSRRNWGVGDLTDLEALMDWVGSLGGGAVATLPLNAAFLDEPFEPVPYSPASRLFWNELYLDVERLPEVHASPQAGAAVAAAQTEIRSLRRGRHVDYRRAMAVKRRILEPVAQRALEGGRRRPEGLERFAAGHPHVHDYARFRAACERYRAPWMRWPAPHRDGRLSDRDVDRRAVRYHLYVQWAMDRQLRAVAAGGPDLYLDLPLGVNPAGFDVWRQPQAFALGVSTGSPPDGFSPTGQDWGFPPLRPEAMRAGGYRYFRDSVAQLLTHAGVLRIDHVMALHRLFWVPAGMEAADGVYVRYRPEELYAVLLLEARRHDAVVVGEDLGTVPGEVRRAMDRHGVRRSYVLQAEARPRRRDALPAAPPGSVAALNTHDMPTFAAFWEGLDIDQRLAVGRLDRREAEEERRLRSRVRSALTSFLRARGLLAGESSTTGQVLGACLAHLAGGPAGMVLAALEDLWLEPEAQNLPGSTDEHPNWRRKARHSLERARSMPDVVGTLRAVDGLRHHRRPR